MVNDWQLKAQIKYLSEKLRRKNNYIKKLKEAYVIQMKKIERLEKEKQK